MESLNFEDKLKLSDEAKTYLRETAKWGKFLAIIGFVMTGLLAIIALSIGVIMEKMSAFSTSPFPFPTTLITILYLGIAAIYIFPCLYLYRFSTKTSIALKNDDTNSLTEALMNQKSLFKFMGILMAILLGFYALIIVFAIIGGVFGTMMK